MARWLVLWVLTSVCGWWAWATACLVVQRRRVVTEEVAAGWWEPEPVGVDAVMEVERAFGHQPTPACAGCRELFGLERRRRREAVYVERRAS